MITLLSTKHEQHRDNPLSISHRSAVNVSFVQHDQCGQEERDDGEGVQISGSIAMMGRTAGDAVNLSLILWNNTLLFRC